jgi:hypothetical protein
VLTPNLFTNLKRIHCLRIVLGFAFFVGIVFSFDLWHSQRSLPTVAILRDFDQLILPFESVVLLSLILLPCLIILVQRPRYLILLLISVSTIAVIGDLNRLQPWLYQYFFMLIALGYFYFQSPTINHQNSLLNASRSIICGIYIWSGIQKFNFRFETITFPWFISPIVLISNETMQITIGILVALLETSIGLALLSKKFRNLGIVMSLAMHILILIILGPTGHNFDVIVWPWNIAMAIFVFILFYKCNSITAKNILVPKSILHGAIILLFMVFPIFSFFGKWDSYVSSKLYSGNTSSAEIIVDPQEAEFLPTELQQFSRSGIINIFKWSTLDTSGPPYPEERFYKGVMKKLCHRLGHNSKAKLKIKSPPHWRTGKSDFQSYDCADL